MWGGVADFSYPTSTLRRGRVQGNGNISPTITTSCGVCKVMAKTVHDYMVTAQDGEEYGIFNLTPRECGRLMGVKDSDIDKMLAVNSRSQCYKQYGNSIVVSVLMAIFSQLNIKGVKPWNDLSPDERTKLIERTCG